MVNLLLFTELEADAEVERQRKEREQRQKQHVLTLSETRDEIARADQRLAELKDEKHQLFLSLKKVLHEDEIRKRQLLTQEANEQVLRYPFTGYPPSAPRIQLMPEGHHHALYSQQPIQLTRGNTGITPSAQVFKVGHQVAPPPPSSGSSHHNASPHSTIPLQVSFNYD